MSENEDIFDKFTHQSSNGSVFVLIEFVAVGLALQDCYPVQLTDYIYLLLRFAVCTVILLMAWIAITVIVNTILKKIKSISEKALYTIWYIIPVVVLLICGFWKMIEA